MVGRRKGFQSPGCDSAARSSLGTRPWLPKALRVQQAEK